LENKRIIVSYDIDGTVVPGDPPGRISIAMISESKKLGYIIGSASDRTITDQTRIWERNDIQMDFIVLKHNLSTVNEQFSPLSGFHIGDTNMDEYYAKDAGFEFIDINGDFDVFWAKLLSGSLM
jgi:hypothetical protein|tara:strand:+ start:97 stop:468 length:372 start_codon:yes stop_codon:yes gene_type:complete